jgi:DNA-binding GntR family transcriptional regulator
MRPRTDPGVRARPGARRGAGRAAPAPPAARASLRDRAYEEIKRRVIRMDYAPGAYLNAAQLCAETGFGMTPVAQALNRLALEGMLEVMPRKGTIVRPVSLEEVLQIIDVRVVNEPYSARLAAERAQPADLAAIESVVARAAALVRRNDVEGLMLLDREFHNRIARAARNPVLAELLRGLHERSLRFWFISLSDRAHLDAVQAEHRAILERLKARDADGAAEAMREHIESFRAAIARSL